MNNLQGGQPAKSGNSADISSSGETEPADISIPSSDVICQAILAEEFARIFAAVE
jgi:hypothetical protein